MNRIKEIENIIKPIRAKLINHDLYKHIETPDDLRIFTEHHIFAVWDFMSLAKALQQRLTCVNVPWTPNNTSSDYSYLINDIILAEESDISRNGQRQSHFEMYLDAMKDLNASTQNIDSFIEQIKHGTDVFLVISASDLPKSVKSFLIFTFNTIFHQQTPEILSAFTFGREHLIPDMFSEIIVNIQHRFPRENISKLKYYFERHIEIDADEHGPMALQLIENICGTDSTKWDAVEKTAIKSLKKRLKLWNGIRKNILTNKAIA
jgi:hypothetical protein